MVAPNEQDKQAVKLAVARFRRQLLRDFRVWSASDPSGFRNFVLGTMKAALPRQRAGRKSNPTVQHANRLYEAQVQNGANGDWRAIAATVVPNYVSLAPASQRISRLKLRTLVHSYRHSRRQRERLSRSRRPVGVSANEERNADLR